MICSVQALTEQAICAEKVDLGSPQKSKLTYSHRKISVGLIPL
jgi:hypothetical protein